MDCIDSMMQEHEVIYRFVGIIQAACCRILEGCDPDVDDFHKMVSFARGYADRHHHGKEEKILFREMTERLGPAAQKVVRNGMLVEHDLGRLHMNELEQALLRYEQSRTIKDKLNIITHACGWAALLKRHMDKENTVVYMFARRELSAEVMEQIDRETQAFNNESANETTARNCLSTLEELAQKYE